MKRFIALLRGINVSGQKKIKMSDLKTLFDKMGFQNVETYIQSGNVIFSSKEKSNVKIAAKISSVIKSKFGFDVQVIVLSPEDLDFVIKNNPFIKKKKDNEKLYVTFLSNLPSKENIQKLNTIDYLPEEFFIEKNIIYLFFPEGYGKARLNNNFFENKLKVSGTTRNWRTINTLSELIALP